MQEEELCPWEFYVGRSLTDEAVDPIIVYVDPEVSARLHAGEALVWAVVITSLPEMEPDHFRENP